MLKSDIEILESDASNVIGRLIRELLNNRCCVCVHTKHNKHYIDIEYSTGEGQYDQRKCCFSGITYEEALNNVLLYIDECAYLSGIRYPHKNDVVHKIKTSLGDEYCETIEIIKFEECPATMVNNNMQYTFKITVDIHFDTHAESVGNKLNNISEALNNLGFKIRLNGCGLKYEDLPDNWYTRYVASYNIEGVLPCS
jgi:hypothetical protein